MQVAAFANHSVYGLTYVAHKLEQLAECTSWNELYIISGSQWIVSGS